jgi:hypothetical protein
VQSWNAFSSSELVGAGSPCSRTDKGGHPRPCQMREGQPKLDDSPNAGTEMRRRPNIQKNASAKNQVETP